jgi:hypothetical protein
MGKTTINRRGEKYGRMSVRRKAGRKKGKVRTVLVHRVVLAEVKGVPLYRINIGMHLCDVTLCAAPHHLRASTQAANMRDCQSKGRH